MQDLAKEDLARWQKDGTKPCRRRIILNEDSFALQDSVRMGNVPKTGHSARGLGVAGVSLRDSEEDAKPREAGKTDRLSGPKLSDVNFAAGLFAKASPGCGDRQGGRACVRNSRRTEVQTLRGRAGSVRKRSTRTNIGLPSFLPALQKKQMGVSSTSIYPSRRGKRLRTASSIKLGRRGSTKQQPEGPGEGRGGEAPSSASLTDELPDDILSEIFCFLPFTEVGTTIPLVSRTFFRLALHPYIWTFFYASAFSPSTSSVLSSGSEAPPQAALVTAQSSSVGGATSVLRGTLTGMVESEASRTGASPTNLDVHQPAASAAGTGGVSENASSLHSNARQPSSRRVTTGLMQPRQSSPGRRPSPRAANLTRHQECLSSQREKNATTAAAFAAAAEEICFVEMEAALRLEREKSALLSRQPAKKRGEEGNERQEDKGGEQTRHVPPRAMSALLAQCHVHRLQRLHALRERQEMLKQQKAPGEEAPKTRSPAIEEAQQRSASSGASVHHGLAQRGHPIRRDLVRRRRDDERRTGVRGSSTGGAAGPWLTGSTQAAFSGGASSMSPSSSRFSLDDFLFFQEGEEKNDTSVASAQPRTSSSQNENKADLVAAGTGGEAGSSVENGCRVISPSLELSFSPLPRRSSSNHSLPASCSPKGVSTVTACSASGAPVGCLGVTPSSRAKPSPSPHSCEAHRAVEAVVTGGAEVAIQERGSSPPVLPQTAARVCSAARETLDPPKSRGPEQLKTSSEEGVGKQGNCCSGGGVLPARSVASEDWAKVNGHDGSVNGERTILSAAGADNEESRRDPVRREDGEEMKESEFLELVFGSSSSASLPIPLASGTDLQCSETPAGRSQPRGASSVPGLCPSSSSPEQSSAAAGRLTGQQGNARRARAEDARTERSQLGGHQYASVPVGEETSTSRCSVGVNTVRSSSSGDRSVNNTGVSSAAGYAARLFAQSPPRSLEDALELWAHAWKDYHRLSRQEFSVDEEETDCPPTTQTEGRAHERACRAGEGTSRRISGSRAREPCGAAVDVSKQDHSIGQREGHADEERKQDGSTTDRYRGDSRAGRTRGISSDSGTRTNGSISGLPCLSSPLRGAPHVCHGRSCDMWGLPQFDLYLCRDSGQAHCCGARCDRLVPSDIDLGFLVCPVSGLMVDPSLISAWKAKECQISAHAGTSFLYSDLTAGDIGQGQRSGRKAGGDWTPGRAADREDNRVRGGREPRWRDLRLRSAELMNELMGSTYVYEQQQQGGTEDDVDEMAGVGGMWGRFWTAGYMAEDESDLPKFKRSKYL